MGSPDTQDDGEVPGPVQRDHVAGNEAQELVGRQQDLGPVDADLHVGGVEPLPQPGGGGTRLLGDLDLVLAFDGVEDGQEDDEGDAEAGRLR